MSLFPRFFFVQFPLSLCMESTSYVLSFRMVFFYIVITGWMFDISLCENSVNQSIKTRIEKGVRLYGARHKLSPPVGHFYFIFIF